MKKKTLGIIGMLCLVCIAVAAIIGYRMYTKPHRSVATEQAVSLTALQLVHAYETDEAASNKKYLGNAVQVSGTVSDVSVNQQNKTVVLLTGSAMCGVQCSLLEEPAHLKKGDQITIKGFCTGFLSDVIMDRCITLQ